MSNCGCPNAHDKRDNKKLWLWIFLARLIVSLALILVFIFVAAPLYVELPVFILAYSLVGFEVVWSALKNITRGKIFDENFLMSVASIAAFAIGEFTEAVALMIFFGVGALFQEMAVERSKKNIAKLMDIRPDHAHIRKGHEIIEIDPKEIKVGDIVVVRPSEKIALDGVIIKGNSFLDTKAITGEPIPRSVNVGDEVLSGTINTESVLEIKVTKPYGESTVAKILDLVQNASEKKSKSEKFITKFAQVYTPIVVLTAIAVALLPPLLSFGTYSEWLYRAIVFLVISCPCALVVSIPVGVFGGIGGSARNGTLIKGGNYLEALNQIKVVAFDKTGTLTKGVFEVSEIITNGISENELLELTAIAEQHSNHPIAKSILAHYGKKITQTADITEKSGMGIIAKFNGKTIHAGNQKLLSSIGLDDLQFYTQTTVYVALNKKYIGCILISDKIKETTKQAIAELGLVGITRTIMLTGDNETTAKEVAKELGITEYYANLLPQDKVTEFEKIKAGTTDKVAFVGDGMNDAPVLTRADIGIAMGGIGSDASIESADIVLMNDDIGKIAVAKKIARKTKRIIVQNICLALGVKAAVMGLAFFGLAWIWLAIFADVGVALLAILNATRCLKKGKRCRQAADGLLL